MKMKIRKCTPQKVVKFHSPSINCTSIIVALGRIPGSERLVLSRTKSTKRNSAPPTAGMAGLRLIVRYRASNAKKMPPKTISRRSVR